MSSEESNELKNEQKKEETKQIPPKSHWIHTTLVGVLCLLGLGLIYRAISLKFVHDRAEQTGCVREKQTFTMNDNYMTGLINRGEVFEVMVDYYKCNPPQAGDVVLYKPSSAKEPVVKIIRAVPDDKFELIQDRRKNRWNIEINGDVLAHRNEPFYFGNRSTESPLEKYLKSRGSRLEAGELLVFSYKPPGIQDSGSLGPVRIDDIVGKVLLNPERVQQVGGNY